MKPLIDLSQEILVQCDKPGCDYNVPALELGKDESLADRLREYVNKPCPKCQSNLCTVEDFNEFAHTMKVFKFINKWFSWLTWFSSAKSVTYTAHVKNGKLNIIEE